MQTPGANARLSTPKTPLYKDFAESRRYLRERTAPRRHKCAASATEDFYERVLGDLRERRGRLRRPLDTGGRRKETGDTEREKLYGEVGR